MFEAVRGIVAEIVQRPAEEITRESTFADLELDSLAIAEFAVASENRLDVVVDIDAISRVDTIGELSDLLSEVAGVAGAAGIAS
ncbi:acyl carrier protein [Streptomyces sp. NPDC056144]|uniref:acyl carrier protein n=1 Tax=unclassified Streptomyces TaxID=2593676 RepID=UPI0035DD20BD